MSLTHCPNYSALAVQPQAINGKRFVARLRCKMWTCEYCAEKNRAIWRAKIIHGIHELGGNWTWFTLTAHRYARGEQKSLDNLRGSWDKLMKRMKRKFGDFAYARIYEQHKDGSYHIHAIASIHFGDIEVRISRKTKETTKYSRWLKKTVWELGLGMYTHADDIEPQWGQHAGFVASYITKYITKLDASTKGEFGRIRHIQTSQNWITKNALESLEKWEFKFGVYYDDVAEAWRKKYEFEDINTKHKITFDDFEDTYIYPPDFDHRVSVANPPTG